LKNDPDKPGKLMVDPNAKLEEELIVRPTSEAIIWSTYKGWYNPIGFTLLINQWANGSMGDENTIVLRTAEFLWQEGHTAHATKTEAIEESERMMNVYADFAEDFMAIPVVKESNGNRAICRSRRNYCIEALMQDGKR
jgi:prolyl-tRNA synthetase